MATSNSNRTRKGSAHPKKRAEPAPGKDEKREDSPDLTDILGRFSDARSFLESAARLLDCRLFESDSPDDLRQSGPGDESIVLHHGLDLLRAAYRDLDKATLKYN